MATGADTPLLLCYDGSEPAKHAIERAADSLGTRHAVVLTVWQPTAVLGSFAWAGATESMLNYVELDRDAAELAERIASEGARVARDAGMRAEPLAVKATGPVWKTILEVAASHDVSTIVIGSGDSPACARCCWGASPPLSSITPTGPRSSSTAPATSTRRSVRHDHALCLSGRAVVAARDRA